MKAFLITLLIVIIVSWLFYKLFRNLIARLDEQLSVEIEDIDKPLI